MEFPVWNLRFLNGGENDPNWRPILEKYKHETRRN